MPQSLEFVSIGEIVPRKMHGRVSWISDELAKLILMA